jgi:hypothetical protein
MPRSASTLRAFALRTVQSPSHSSSRSAKIAPALRFYYCTFQNEINLQFTELPFLAFHHCKGNKGIRASGLKTDASITFIGYEAAEEINLVGARIGGILNFSRSALAARGNALEAGGAKIGDRLLFNDCRSLGDIRLVGTEIGGNLEFLDTTVFNVTADTAKITHHVILNQGFSCYGVSSFSNAEIGGNLTCAGAEITQLNCDGARIVGSLAWLAIRQPSQSSLTLNGATVGALHDDRPSWPAQGKLRILDFVYQDLVLHGPPGPGQPLGPALTLNPEERVEWLMRQPANEVAYAQPWMQLAKLVQADGDTDGAKWVVYKYKRLRARHENPALRLTSWLYDQLEEQPLRIGLPIIVLGLIGSLIFWRAKRIRAMAPTSKDALTSFESSRTVPAGYPPFNPVVYTLENVLPVVKLGQDSTWAPNHLASPESWLPTKPAWLRIACHWGLTRWITRVSYRRLSALRWTLILLGWALALILAAAIGSRFKS